MLKNGVERPTVLEATVGFYVPDAHRPILGIYTRPSTDRDHARTAIDYTVLVMHSHIRPRFSHNCTIAWSTRAGAAAEAAARFHRIKGAHDAYGIGGGKSGRCCCCLLPLLLEPVDGVLGRGEGARRLLEQLVVHRRQLVTATRAGEHTSAVRALFTAACKEKACVCVFYAHMVILSSSSSSIVKADASDVTTRAYLPLPAAFFPPDGTMRPARNCICSRRPPPPVGTPLVGFKSRES